MIYTGGIPCTAEKRGAKYSMGVSGRGGWDSTQIAEASLVRVGCFYISCIVSTVTHLKCFWSRGPLLR